MKILIVLSMLIYCVNGNACEVCPNEKAFCDHGWIIHSGKDFVQILEEKMSEFIPQVGTDLVLDDAESYMSHYSHDAYLIMWIVIFDRISTVKDEMWGDVAFIKTGPDTEDYAEVRWYDPETKKKHIVCNPEYAYCLTTKVPLAYNTIF
ncbi:MAG: hypothetical protein ACN4GW_20820 [Desulforhopalus sp.]